MKIAFDIDDTMTRHWEFFAFITKALVAADHEVFIITFRTNREEVKAKLKQRGIEWNHLFVADNMDNVLDVGPERWKGLICKQFGVEILFDDMPEIINHLPSTTLGMMAVDESLGLLCYD